MPALSIFDMLKIGVGPSSSHTLGPWRAIQRWMDELREEVALEDVDHIQVVLYGSLALTGRGHCTDKAIVLALLGYDPVTVPVEEIDELVDALCERRHLALTPEHTIPFDPVADIVFMKSERLPFHANGMRCLASAGTRRLEATFFSIGGGFVVKEGEDAEPDTGIRLPYPTEHAADLARHCARDGLRIADMVWANEQAWRTEDQIAHDLRRIWLAMKACVYRGCHTEGTLPGGLQVRRRARAFAHALVEGATFDDVDAWIEGIRVRPSSFRDVLKWVACFALAVNEENAGLGRVVTAPTNGAAGVIPAVLMYHVCFSPEPVTDAAIADFLMVAGEIGTIFKKRATISAAMGGCQAEIGVSSAMAAAALTEAQGGSVDQALMAAEIAMEHHLGMTCDPIDGLVQIPCIERNAMGAIKAINAATLALESDPAQARVSLDDVIRAMWDTARDMNSKYKETSQGGLAVNISVRVPEC